ncbi:MAG TPA: hypothetical protein VFA55_05755 [Candidatus Kapabacteria bacterium]|nr:hypothetical protein [Candidatus Kapabacteria bacterium]
MRTALFLLVLLFASLQLRAQEIQPRLFLGVIGGYNSDYHNGGFMSYFDSTGTLRNAMNNPASGNGYGIIIGMAGEYWFNDEGSTSLQFKMYFEQKPGSFTWTGMPHPYYDSTSGQNFFYWINKRVKVQYNLLNFEFTYVYDVPFLSHFGVSIGPKFGVVTYTSYYDYDTIMPAPFVFGALNSNTMLIVDQSIPSAYAMRLAVKLGLQYELLVDRFLITPAVWYDYGITKIAPGWQINTFAGTVDVKYGI